MPIVNTMINQFQVVKQTKFLGVESESVHKIRVNTPDDKLTL